MILLKVYDALNNLAERTLGYTRMVSYVDGGPAEERTLDTYSTKEILNVTQKDCSAYYTIGEYAYIIYKE